MLSERRAAVVALVAGFVVFATRAVLPAAEGVLRRRAHRAVLTVGYSAAFWNATEGVGFGARAVKSVIAPDEVSERDASSDVYRVIENYNLVFTIRAEPLTGVGFGKPFYQPRTLPDISFFVFYQYIPHNSILWIWLNMGYVGFVALLFVIAAALRAGTRASLRLPSGDALAVTVGALAFIVMFFVFAFVDIAWDARMLPVPRGLHGHLCEHAATVERRPRPGRLLTLTRRSESLTPADRRRSWGSASPTRAPSSIAAAASSASLIVTSMSR